MAAPPASYARRAGARSRCVTSAGFGSDASPWASTRLLRASRALPSRNSCCGFVSAGAAVRGNARGERTNAASQVALRTRTAVEAWLKNRPGGTTIEDWVGPDPKPAKSEDIITTVSRLERRTRELRAD